MKIMPATWALCPILSLCLSPEFQSHKPFMYPHIQRQLVLIRLYCHTPTGMQSPEMKLLTTVKSCYLKPFLQPPYMLLYFIIFTLFFQSLYNSGGGTEISV